VMPANYCLRAIPLAAGHHRLVLEYLPRAFVIGRMMSLVAVAGYLGLFAWHVRKRFGWLVFRPK